jgi:hypothetical protein
MGKNGQFWEILAKSVKFSHQLIQLANQFRNQFYLIQFYKTLKTSKKGQK